uniref:Dynein light chain n=1 Tax=Mesocestoides corti TaxID=53468 RepID=A0A5K3ENN6_MESCO
MSKLTSSTTCVGPTRPTMTPKTCALHSKNDSTTSTVPRGTLSLVNTSEATSSTNPRASATSPTGDCLSSCSNSAKMHPIPPILLLLSHYTSIKLKFDRLNHMTTTKTK